MNQSSWKSRKNLASRMLVEHPDKIPALLIPLNPSANYNKLPQNKFLVPKQYSFHDFVFVIRKKLRLFFMQTFTRLSPEDSLFLMVNKSIDNFLYIFYSSEPAWG